MPFLAAALTSRRSPTWIHIGQALVGSVGALAFFFAVLDNVGVVAR